MLCRADTSNVRTLAWAGPSQRLGAGRRLWCSNLSLHLAFDKLSGRVSALIKYQLWRPWLYSSYGTLASTVRLFNSEAYWLDMAKLPAERRSW